MPEDLMSMNPAEIVADIDEFGEPLPPATPAPETPPATPEVPEVKTPEPAPVLDPEKPDPEKPTPEQDKLPADPEKKVQTPEENAKFAEQRRQQQIEQRVQQELEKIRQQSPEFQMAQKLSEIYGKPVDQLYAELQESAIQQQAKAQNVPVEMIRQQQAGAQRTAALEQQLQQMKFDTWVGRVDTEASTLKTKYPMLSDTDMDEAKMFLLDTLKNPDLPLDRAVYALHGEKIATGFRELAKQEALAEISGRAAAPLPPQGGKPPATNTLTDDEREMAANLGISDEEYLKWK